jgi:hypothetical protein
MFRILCDPSSGSTQLCWTEITRSDSQIFCHVLGWCLAAQFCTCGMCVWDGQLGQPYRTHTPQVQNCAAKH